MLSLLAVVAATSPRDEPSSYYMFVFTKVRFPPRPIQLQEVELFGTDPTQPILGVTSALNPGGRSPGQQPPADAIDNDLWTGGSKWLDFNMETTGRSELLLKLPHPAVVTGYDLITANDVIGRDPVSWSFSKQLASGEWFVMDEQLKFNAPEKRFASYGRFSLSLALPPPPAGAAPPLSPPPPPSPSTSTQTSQSPTRKPPPSPPLPPSAPLSLQTGQTANQRPGESNPPDAGAIAGGVIGGVIGLLLLILLMGVVWRRTQGGTSLRQVNQKVDSVALALHDMAREVKELNGRAIVLVESDLPEGESEEDGTRRLEALSGSGQRSPKRFELELRNRSGSPGRVSPAIGPTPSATPSEPAPASPTAIAPAQPPPWVPVVPVDAPMAPQHAIGDSAPLAPAALPPILPVGAAAQPTDVWQLADAPAANAQTNQLLVGWPDGEHAQPTRANAPTGNGSIRRQRNSGLFSV